MTDLRRFSIICKRMRRIAFMMIYSDLIDQKLGHYERKALNIWRVSIIPKYVIRNIKEHIGMHIHPSRP